MKKTKVSKLKHVFAGEAMTWVAVGHVLRDAHDDKFTFLESIKDHEEVYEKHKKVFKILGGIHHVVTRVKPTKEQLAHGASLCKDLGHIFPINFPLETITRKQHVIIVVLPKFILEGSCYKFSKIEQMSENLHCQFNDLERTFACYKNKSLRYFHCLRKFTNVRKTDLSKFQ